MRKKIPVTKILPGMHLSEICGSWLEHPFWRSEFILNEQDVRALQNSAITEVWIDFEKSLPHAKKQITGAGEDEDQVNRQVELQLSGIDQKQTKEPVRENALPAPSNLSEEAVRAKAIVKNAADKVSKLFGEARMGKALTEDDAIGLVEEISNSVFRNPNALISIARLKNKDDYTYMHSVAVCALMVSLAKCMGYGIEFCKKAGMAGLYHDIGKMFIPDEILNKPGKLTDEEFEIVKSHPQKGWELLSQSPGISPETLEVCLRHHEKVDGSGYPGNLADGQMSILSKMSSICDVYDAITSDRPYKKGWEPSESIKKMAEWKGHFDPNIFQAFVKSIGIYPVGSLVKLSSGKLGVVVDKGEKSLLTPKVKVFYSTKSNVRIIPEVIDLARPGCKEKIESRENMSSWNFGDLSSLWMS